MLVYGATMFLSAFLLFLVQPMIGKFILPWFGGAPAVWTACMLCFQALLLAGYAYAHILASNWPLRRQARVHVALLIATAAAVLWFSIAPSQAWKPEGSESPVTGILGLLLASIGAPFLLLSATAPLLQSWFSRTRPERFPYRLYALSNLGSLLAIVSYPFLIEPSIALQRQATLWSWTYAAFALACGLVAWQVMSARAIERGGDSTMERALHRPDAASYFRWLALTACSSIMLLATTSMMSQDLAVVPLLWILPLALYLLSFVICFQHERLYWRPLFVTGLVASAAWVTYVLSGSVFVPLHTQIMGYSVGLFMVCMVCHGELVRLRPAPAHLTSFYLMVAGGGALGGFLVTVVAPGLLSGFWEYHFGLLATTLLVLWIIGRDFSDEPDRRRTPQVWALIAVLGVLWLALALVLGRDIRESLARNVEMTRNFFGVLRVQELYATDPSEHQFSLVHGRIEHGSQFKDPVKRTWPVTYYGYDSGMGVALGFHPNRIEGGALRIGVIGLGTGTVAAHGRAGDVIRFYEINPEVVRLSDTYFTYRKDTQARSDVTLGDARVSLERARAQGLSEGFDVLVVDAFSSDAIPVHLLTRECFDTFRFHMKPDGIVAFHITNRYFDLSPVVRNLIVPGPGPEMQALLFTVPGSPSQGTSRTDWILMTTNEAFLGNPEVRARVTPWPDAVPKPIKWTDDYSNLVGVIHERGRN
jgi:hypothetical protein